MARIFASPDFEASRTSASLYQALAALPEHVVVLLEFYSAGPKNRQVDAAVCGPYGLDVLCIKNITGGTVLSSEKHAWKIRLDNGDFSSIPMNVIEGVQENPWAEAQNTADDLRNGLSKTFRQQLVGKIFPTVVIPEGSPDRQIQRRSFIRGVNGIEELTKHLRSLEPYVDELPVWTEAQRLQFPKEFGLVEIEIATASGLEADALRPEQPHSHGSSNTGLTATMSSWPEPAKAPPVESEARPPEPIGRPPAPERSSPTHRPRLAMKGTITVVLAILIIGAGLAAWPRGENAVNAGSHETTTMAVTADISNLPEANPKSLTPIPEEAASETKQAPRYVPDSEAEVSTALPVVAEGTALSNAMPLPGTPIKPSTATGPRFQNSRSGCPSSHPVKGNINARGERIFHVTGQQFYDATNPEECFATPAEARERGFRPSAR